MVAQYEIRTCTTSHGKMNELAGQGWQLKAVSHGVAYFEREITSETETQDILADPVTLAAVAEGDGHPGQLHLWQDVG